MSGLRDYFFDEMPAGERPDMERQLAASPELRAELRQLEMTARALRMLPDQEPPRRIAFVSDKVLAPSVGSRVARWFFAAGPVFASAALSALVVFWVMSYRTAPVRTVEVASSHVAQDPGKVEALVREAVAQSEVRSAQKTKELLADAERRHELERQQLLLNVQDTLNYWQKKMNVMQVASADMGGR
ncbi:MAG TPA: hypothetical protein DEQ47_18660 [Solibacterales bacterium]|nr:hypothetical protein [Bryobacterales bacterium]